MAVVQANNLLEDQSQLESGCLSLNESGPYCTSVGVYDGHVAVRHCVYQCSTLSASKE